MSNRQVNAIAGQIAAITHFVTGRYSTLDDEGAIRVRQELRHALQHVSGDCTYRAAKRRCVARMAKIADRDPRGAA
jgi:hypothetical protein